MLSFFTACLGKHDTEPFFLFVESVLYYSPCCCTGTVCGNVYGPRGVVASGRPELHVPFSCAEFNLGENHGANRPCAKLGLHILNFDTIVV